MYWKPHYVASTLARKHGASYEVAHELVPFAPTHRLRSVAPGFTRKWIHEDYVVYDREPGAPIGWGLLPATIGAGPDETPAYAFDPSRGAGGAGVWMSTRPGAAGGPNITIDAELVRLRGPSRLDTLGAVYFVRAGDLPVVKIGWSTDVARRVAELQTANAAQLRLLASMPGTLVTERTLHERFSYARSREDGEWFDLGSAPELLVTINTLRGLSGLTPIMLNID